MGTEKRESDLIPAVGISHDMESAVKLCTRYRIPLSQQHLEATLTLSHPMSVVKRCAPFQYNSNRQNERRKHWGVGVRVLGRGQDKEGIIGT